MTRRRLSVALVVLVLLVSGVAWAQTPAGIAEWRVEANAGDASSQWVLGYYYENGRGVPQDHAQAMSWYRKAAEQGHVLAQVNLGFAYANGQGVPQDYVEAHKWLNLAASRGTPSQERYAEARDALAAKMTPAQIAEAQKLAREWHAAFEGR
ncbi:sel1 repeat family protein [bacterium AH-315-O15]|nr:sel1 repeat family protein [bacterium AH-315-O15]